MNDKQIDKIDLDKDYGFTFENEETSLSNSISSLQDEVDDLKARLHTIKTIFEPFLCNLIGDPNKPMIKWPNRSKIIKEQLNKLYDLTKV